MTREELIEAAAELHDRECRSCDRKYRMSCPNMANAILKAGSAFRAGLPECACHEWHDVDVIGDWVQGNIPEEFRPVRVLAQDPGIWTPPRCDLSREELTARITAAGGISHEHALEGIVLEDGTIVLGNGVHRWTIASQLGIRRLPVDMHYCEPQEDPAADYE